MSAPTDVTAVPAAADAAAGSRSAPAVGRRSAERVGPPLLERSRELGEGWAQPPSPGDAPDSPRPGEPGGTPVPGTATTEAPPTRTRLEGMLLGLAAGDAAGWPAARHRAARMPEWTRRLTRELDTFAEQNATTTLPVPIALNQPPEPLRLGPSDDAEWAAYTATALLAGPGNVRGALDHNWATLAAQIAAAAARAPEVESAVVPLRARISVRAGLGNLATGLRPPATGHDNPHFFDDAACVRGCVLAAVHAGDPESAAELAEFDARYTQDGDGVHGARAMAAALAVALAEPTRAAQPDRPDRPDGPDRPAQPTGSTGPSGSTGPTHPDDAVTRAVDAALAQLPETTEIGRNARHAVSLAREHAASAPADLPASAGVFGLIPLLEHEIVDHVYSYGIAAAETVPVALALATAARGDLATAVPAAACLSRVADSAPALAGALTGALGGADAVPDTWRSACRALSGCALPRLAGTDLVQLAAELAAALSGLLAARPDRPPREDS
ncbi:ADP-ribosylglycohydrolase family protein [Streptomyces sp. NPDC002851]